MNQTNIVDYVKALKLKGVSTNDIATEFNVSPSTVRRWISGEMIPKVDRIVTTTTTTSYNIEDDIDIPVNTVTPYTRPSFKKQEEIEDIKEFIASLAPIHYPTPTRPTVIQTPNKIALIAGDFHFGCECQNSINLFLKAVEELKPSVCVLNGDLLDMFAISKYPKDVRYTYSLSQEREKYHKFLKVLHDITAPYNTQIYETNSNHSGNSSCGRYWRYLSDRIGEMADLPEVIEALSYENVFFPKAEWSRITLVDYVELVPNWIIMHGDVSRKRSGQSALGMMEKYFTNLVINHCHRIGFSARRIPGIGSDSGKNIRVYENGTLANLNPIYSQAADWQNGFCIVNYSDQSNVAVEQVIIENNACAISTLGKTLRVRD